MDNWSGKNFKANLTDTDQPAAISTVSMNLPGLKSIAASKSESNSKNVSYQVQSMMVVVTERLSLSISSCAAFHGSVVLWLWVSQIWATKRALLWLLCFANGLHEAMIIDMRADGHHWKSENGAFTLDVSVHISQRFLFQTHLAKEKLDNSSPVVIRQLLTFQGPHKLSCHRHQTVEPRSTLRSEGNEHHPRWQKKN